MHQNDEQNTTLIRIEPATEVIPRQADSDEQLIDLWLHGRSCHTQRAYRSDVRRFMQFVEKPVRVVTLGDVQAFADELDEQYLKSASQHRILSAVKSLLSFGHRIGYLPFDVGRPLRLPSCRDGLSERILSEGDVQRMIALEPNERNRVMLLLLYASGVRVSELCSLRWNDLQARDDGGQIAVFGKGGRTRHILLPQSVWSALIALRNGGPDEAALFKSRKGGHLSASQSLRIVKRAARRAGVTNAASPHWFRHSHASHALDRGAAIHLVQATLGHSSVATTGRYLHARPDDSSARYLPI